MNRIKVIIRSLLFKLINFICYGDLPTSYYLQKGMIIGNNFHRQTGTKFDPSHCWLISIGNDVTIANNVQILAHDDSPRFFSDYGKLGKVRIGDNSFIGARTIILPNVTIGENVIIGAGSVVVKDIPPNTIAVGNPARIHCSIDDYLAKCTREMQVKDKVFGKEYCNRNLSKEQKEELISACKDGFCYIQMGKVIEYGRKS